jgi:hypothetical protein
VAFIFLFYRVHKPGIEPGILRVFCGRTHYNENEAVMRRYEKCLLKTTIPQRKVTQLLIMYRAMVDAGFLKTRV